MHFWNDPRWVEKTPLVTVWLFESANLGQIARMITHRTAAGQSLISWVLVNAALWAWWNFYRTFDRPEFRHARRVIRLGIAINFSVILAVIYFRYWVGNG